MQLAELEKLILARQARLGVIGLGYVGLTLACEFASQGFDVSGIDLLGERVADVNAARLPFSGSEPGLQELLQSVRASGKLHASADYQTLATCQVILVCVETPVSLSNRPDYRALGMALSALGKVLALNALVIIESTLSPGSTQRLVVPLLEGSSNYELNQGFFLGVCPERVMPGKLLLNLRTLPRVVGGMTPRTARVMASLYRTIVQADLDLSDCITAELVKTVENAYRDVQIAFANEIALLCEAAGGDVWQVRELVNKSPGRQMLLPGAGVGGHCIPKDPWLLASAGEYAGLKLEVIPAARQVNDNMPLHMLELLRAGLAAAGRSLEGARLLVMGVAYLEESGDTRNSPSLTLLEVLRRNGAEVILHDPYAPGYQGDLLQLAAGCDGAVVMVRHQAYRELDLATLAAALRTPLLVDGRGVYSPGQAAAAGLRYILLGRAEPGT